MADMDDREFITLLTEGDEQKGMELFILRYLSIFAYLNKNYFRKLNLDDYDLLHDFYLYLRENDWKRLRSFNFESQLGTWIYVVASRYLLRKNGSGLKEIPLRSPLIDGIKILVDGSLDLSLVRADLLEAIARLKDKRERQVMLLALNGYNTEEIAEKIGTSVNNIYTIKSRVIKKLRNLLNE